jgi:NAD(P)-dependent dehydrogenase (short-subunit alcohol dehydrogenase family)
MSPSSSESDLSGRAVLVTGGTRGIGLGIARRFREAGAAVLVCARKPPEELPEGIDFAPADVRESDQAAGVVREAIQRYGRLDVAINNAGGSPRVPASDASPRLIRAIVDLNLTAPFLVAQAAHAVMRDQPDGGLILNIGSASAMRPAPGTAAYAAAKAGLIVLTRALAVEWAPAVRVNCVTVGLIHTEASAGHYDDPTGAAATVPFGRMATPADVAGACLLLASPLAAYITGANLVVDGGGEIPAFLSAAG